MEGEKFFYIKRTETHWMAHFLSVFGYLFRVSFFFFSFSRFFVCVSIEKWWETWIESSDHWRLKTSALPLLFSNFEWWLACGERPRHFLEPPSFITWSCSFYHCPCWTRLLADHFRTSVFYFWLLFSLRIFIDPVLIQRKFRRRYPADRQQDENKMLNKMRRKSHR